MEILLIIGMAIVVVLIFRPVRRSQIVYVPIEIQEVQGRGWGCLCLLIIAALGLLVSNAI